MKVSKIPVDPANFGFYVNNLWSAFALMDSKEQIRKLFKDLFTHTEYKMFTKRLEIARRLLEGQKYEEIMQDLKVTERTIANISNILARDGEGLRIAHTKLTGVQKRFEKQRDEHQKRLERSGRPKLIGEDVLPYLLKVGAESLTKSIAKKMKKSSVRKNLDL